MQTTTMKELILSGDKYPEGTRTYLERGAGSWFLTYHKGEWRWGSGEKSFHTVLAYELTGPRANVPLTTSEEPVKPDVITGPGRYEASGSKSFVDIHGKLGDLWLGTPEGYNCTAAFHSDGRQFRGTRFHIIGRLDD